jgi:hypothetical protein
MPRENTRRKIVEDLSVKWINYRRSHYEIAREEKLWELSWKEIERDKYKEEIPDCNELMDRRELFLMN